MAQEEECKSCPAGSEAALLRVYEVWDAWPRGKVSRWLCSAEKRTNKNEKTNENEGGDACDGPRWELEGWVVC